jgi:alpha-L-fucosidase
MRFTTKGNTLYAIVLAWPEDRKVIIKSLPAKSEPVTEVDLLGDDSELQWRQTPSGLEVVFPVERPCDHAFSLKITRQLKHGARNP